MSISEDSSGRIDADGWTEHYGDSDDATATQRWPAENLIRMLMGSYIPGLDREHAGRDVLDVGCGNGNNLVFLGATGMNLFGTEIDQGVILMCSRGLIFQRFELDGENFTRASDSFMKRLEKYSESII